MNVVLTRKADRDLQAQVAWYSSNRSRGSGRRFLIAAERTLRLLSEVPTLGSPLELQDKDVEGIKWFQVKSFPNVILYFERLPSEGILKVLRVQYSGVNPEWLEAEFG